MTQVILAMNNFESAQATIDGLTRRLYVAAGCVVGAIALAPMLWRKRANANERQPPERHPDVHQE